MYRILFSTSRHYSPEKAPHIACQQQALVWVLCARWALVWVYARDASGEATRRANLAPRSRGIAARLVASPQKHSVFSTKV